MNSHGAAGGHTMRSWPDLAVPAAPQSWPRPWPPASLARLRAAEHRLTQASKPVEQAVAIIRRQLGLPPPETS
jgi:hypothetical protein